MKLNIKWASIDVEDEAMALEIIQDIEKLLAGIYFQWDYEIDDEKDDEEEPKEKEGER
jgi:hypothetical protein